MLGIVFEFWKIPVDWRIEKVYPSNEDCPIYVVYHCDAQVAVYYTRKRAISVIKKLSNA